MEDEMMELRETPTFREKQEKADPLQTSLTSQWPCRLFRFKHKLWKTRTMLLINIYKSYI